MPLDEPDSAELNERHAQIGRDGTIEKREQVGKQRIRVSSNQRPVVWSASEKTGARHTGAEIVSFVRNDVSNSSPRVGHIAAVARNQMNVQMKDGLPRFC